LIWLFGVNIVHVLQLFITGLLSIASILQNTQSTQYAPKVVYNNSLDGYEIWDTIYRYFEWIIWTFTTCLLEFATVNLGSTKASRTYHRTKNRLHHIKYTRYRKTLSCLLKFYNTITNATKTHTNTSSPQLFNNTENHMIHWESIHAFTINDHTSKYMRKDDIDHRDVITCNAIADAEAFSLHTSRFDSDSFPIKFDNCCTKSSMILTKIP
jgi:hypothetical protein